MKLSELANTGKVTEIFKILYSHSGKHRLVGGCIRNVLMNVEVTPVPASDAAFSYDDVRPRSLLDVNEQGEQRSDRNEGLFAGTGII